jgi:hypothetical protein
MEVRTAISSNYPTNLSKITLRYPSEWTVISLHCQGVKRILILDSGSCCGILEPGAADEPKGCIYFAQFGVTRKYLEVQAEHTFQFLMGCHIRLHFIVRKLKINTAGVLRITFYYLEQQN